MRREQAYEYRRKIEKAASVQSDEMALESIELFPRWEVGITVSAGERYQFSGKLFKVIQGHTTQGDWTPDKTPALFTEVSVDEWPEWVRPTGGHDCYNKGDKVTFESEHYISLIDNNSWAPTEYPAGWEKQS